MSVIFFENECNFLMRDPVELSEKLRYEEIKLIVSVIKGIWLFSDNISKVLFGITSIVKFAWEKSLWASIDSIGNFEIYPPSELVPVTMILYI